MDIPEEINWNTDNYEPNVITSSSNHLGFPDLIYHKGTWFVTYRESDGHVGTFSKIKVLKSNDFKKWEECNTFELSGWDLRDPKFSYDDLKDSLYLHVYATDKKVPSNYYFRFDNLLKSFDMDREQLLKINLPENVTSYWLWDHIWYKGDLYVAGYRTDNVRFYKFYSLNDTPQLFAFIRGNGVTEAKLQFYNGSLYALIRRWNDALLGEVILPVNNLDISATINDESSFYWTEKFSQLKALGGPNMVIADSVFYIGGRVLDENNNPRTSLYQYSLKDRDLKHLETFISYGDNSYPGMVLRENTIYGCYYTLAPDYQGYQIRSFIRPI